MKKTIILLALAFCLNANAQVVSTLAGSTTHGSNNGIGTAAKFWNPSDVAIDMSGNLYVADDFNSEIRKIVISTGQVSTFAGSTTYGSADGIGSAASFKGPQGITYDGAGNLYIADTGNNEIRKIVTSSGLVTTIAGSTTAGSNNGIGTAAKFSGPDGLTCDGNGNLFICDQGSMIRKIVISTGVVSTLAGSITPGFANGTGTAAKFNLSIGLACDGNGNLYVADANNYQIRKIVISTGVVSTLVGSITNTVSVDGTGTSAGIGDPNGITYDGNGNLYFTDGVYNTVRKVVISSGVVTTIAGTGVHGSTDGIVTVATFGDPYGITNDKNGNLYIADTFNHEIRMITNATGIENIELDYQLTIYPNPAQQVINIEFKTQNNMQTTIEMFNIMGECVHRQTSTSSNCRINVVNLNEGIYNISITNSVGTVNKKLLIVR